MTSPSKIFKTKKSIIGMVHLKPLLGYPEFSSVEDVVDAAVEDAKTLEKAGFDALLVENNYDLPHKIHVEKEVVALFTYVAQKVIEQVSVPVGICVLWNDYQASLSIAKSIGGKFIRIPAFVDSVMTSYGKAEACAEKAVRFRKRIQAEDILLLTDIQVKHSELLNKRPIEESAKEAVESGSDGLIITGKWTGDQPNVDDLKKVRDSVGDFPIYIGSGATVENAEELLKYANVIIVGTSIKTGKVLDKKKQVNLKSYDERIDLEKAQAFISGMVEHII